jgi:hypothetical protein
VPLKCRIGRNELPPAAELPQTALWQEALAERPVTALASHTVHVPSRPVQSMNN